MTEKYRRFYLNIFIDKLLPKFTDYKYEKWAKEGLKLKSKLFDDKFKILNDECSYPDEIKVGPTFYYLLTRRFHLIESLWEGYISYLGYNINPKIFICPTIELNHFMLDFQNNYWTKKYYVESNNYRNIDAFVEDFWSSYLEKMIPILESTDTIKKLDKIINYDSNIPKRIFHHRGYEFKRMIIAKLAGNPDYENVFQEVLEAIEMKKGTEPNKYEGFKYVYGEIIKKLESVGEYIG